MKSIDLTLSASLKYSSSSFGGRSSFYKTSEIVGLLLGSAFIIQLISAHCRGWQCSNVLGSFLPFLTLFNILTRSCPF
jgi:hypothetical protein